MEESKLKKCKDDYAIKKLVSNEIIDSVLKNHDIYNENTKRVFCEFQNDIGDTYSTGYFMDNDLKRIKCIDKKDLKYLLDKHKYIVRAHEESYLFVILSIYKNKEGQLVYLCKKDEGLVVYNEEDFKKTTKFNDDQLKDSIHKFVIAPIFFIEEMQNKLSEELCKIYKKTTKHKLLPHVFKKQVREKLKKYIYSNAKIKEYDKNNFWRKFWRNRLKSNCGCIRRWAIRRLGSPRLMISKDFYKLVLSDEFLDGFWKIMTETEREREKYYNDNRCDSWREILPCILHGLKIKDVCLKIFKNKFKDTSLCDESKLFDCLREIGIKSELIDDENTFYVPNVK